MLTPLSVLSLDQGPKWRQPAPEPEPAEKQTPEAAPGRLEFLRSLVARLAGLSWRPGPSQSRA
jgi:hypothetical protein